jgi:hypothetical protein
MILKLLVSGVVLFGAFFAGQTVSSGPQDEKDAAKKAKEEMAKMMEMYEKAAQPTDIHKALAKLAGKWNQTSKFDGMPGMPPCEGKGTAEYKSIIGGRFVTCDVTGEMPDMTDPTKMKAFTGFQLLGYDTTTKQYQMAWVDNMGTGIWWTTGTPDASGKTVTFDGTAKDVLTPQGRPFRFVWHAESDDKHTLEMWDAMDGKTLTKMGVITETRVK